jgi:hypothetical protein
MKKILVLTCLLSGLAITAKAETKILTEDGESFSLQAGQFAKCVSFIHIDSRNRGYITIKHKERSFSFGSSTYLRFVGDHLPVIPGPATITLKIGTKAGYGRGEIACFVIENDSGPGDSNNVTVIPDSTEVATLVLEGSDDMVNWTEETLGEKPKANRKKFYRLRVKKD